MSAQCSGGCRCCQPAAVGVVRYVTAPAPHQLLSRRACSCRSRMAAQATRHAFPPHSAYCLIVVMPWTGVEKFDVQFVFCDNGTKKHPKASQVGAGAAGFSTHILENGLHSCPHVLSPWQIEVLLRVAAALQAPTCPPLPVRKLPSASAPNPASTIIAATMCRSTGSPQWMPPPVPLTC